MGIGVVSNTTGHNICLAGSSALHIIAYDKEVINSKPNSDRKIFMEGVLRRLIFIKKQKMHGFSLTAKTGMTLTGF